MTPSISQSTAWPSNVEIAAETPRLILRRQLPGDLAIWLQHMNTPEVMGMVGGVQPPEKVAESFAQMAAEDSPLVFYLLALKDDGTLIGKCGLALIETEVAPGELRQAAQVGWTLRADYWGKGYAREAAEAALEIAFCRLGLARVYSQTSERNRSSWGLMLRLGMRRRDDLDYFDSDYPPEDNPTMVWELTREAWSARREHS